MDVSDFLVGLGLVFVIEGLVYAVMPAAMRNMVVEVTKLPDAQLRRAGLAALCFGVFVVWLVRG